MTKIGSYDPTIFQGAIGNYVGWTILEPHAESASEPDAPRLCSLCKQPIRDGRCACMIG